MKDDDEDDKRAALTTEAADEQVRARVADRASRGTRRPRAKGGARAKEDRQCSTSAGRRWPSSCWSPSIVIGTEGSAARRPHHRQVDRQGARSMAREFQRSIEDMAREAELDRTSRARSRRLSRVDVRHRDRGDHRSGRRDRQGLRPQPERRQSSSDPRTPAAEPGMTEPSRWRSRPPSRSRSRRGQARRSHACRPVGRL